MPPRKKRESELQRPRSRKGGASKDATRGLQGEFKDWPEPKEEWDDEIRDIYESAMISGGEQFYEQSDIAFLRLLLDDLNAMRRGSGGAEKYKALLSQLGQMLLTEADRRKANIELQPRSSDEGTKAADVLQMEEYRTALGQ